MTPADQDDLLLRMLSRLPSPAPDAARSERIVGRCHASMRRRDRWERQRRTLARRIVEPAVVGVFALAYLAAVIREVWHWHHGL